MLYSEDKAGEPDPKVRLDPTASVSDSMLDANVADRAIIEVNPDAISIASETDEERKRGIVRGPLHGIPFVVKDVCNPLRPYSQCLVLNLVNRTLARTIKWRQQQGQEVRNPSCLISPTNKTDKHPSSYRDRRPGRRPRSRQAPRGGRRPPRPCEPLRMGLHAVIILVRPPQTSICIQREC